MLWGMKCIQMAYTVAGFCEHGNKILGSRENM
jgi:hypothetical protein